MKHFYLLIAVVFTYALADAQIVNIPDANFKNRLVNELCASLNENGSAEIDVDTNNDGEIQVSEAAVIKYLNIQFSEIASIEGISAFTNLKKLFANSNAIVTADFSNMPSLSQVQIAYNSLTSISFNPSIINVDVSHNQLTSMESLSGLINLGWLDCSYNQLTTLNIDLPNLQLLDFSHNQVSSFNVTAPILDNLSASFNLLTTLDVSALPLKTLYCAHNQLTQLTLTPSIEILGCSNNQLTSLDLSGFELVSLTVGYNQLTTLTIPPFKTNNSYGIDAYGAVEISGNLYTSVANMPTAAYTFGCNDTKLLSVTIPQINSVPMDPFEIKNNADLQMIDARNIVLCQFSNEFDGCKLTIENNPALQAICVIPTSLTLENQTYFAANNGPNVILSTYCDATPGGNYNTTTGTIRFDYAGNGCTSEDLAASGIRVNMATLSNFELGATMTNDQGTYTAYSTNYNPSNNVVLTPQLENGYFTVTPASFTTAFTGYGNTATADFCIAPNGVYPDLEIAMIPITPARPGFDAIYKIHFENKGTETQSGTISLEFEDEATDLVSADPAVAAQATNLLTWEFTDLAPFESREITLTLNLNSPLEIPAVDIGYALNFIANIDAGIDETPADNTFAEEQTVVGSFDPNDKLVSEEIIDLDHLDDYLYYTVRFQNTGTFYAEKVVVKDMLSSNLDLTTLQMVSASHPYRSTLTSGNILEFFFEGINLPAVGDDEPGSHGYVTFKIKPVATLPVYSEIFNEASIYFDFNAPIVTNTVATMLQALSNPEIAAETFVLYPNPVKNTLSIQTNQIVKTISIYNTLGQLFKTVGNQQNAIDISELSPGTYLVQIVSDTGKANKKLIKL